MWQSYRKNHFGIFASLTFDLDLDLDQNVAGRLGDRGGTFWSLPELNWTVCGSHSQKRCQLFGDFCVIDFDLRPFKVKNITWRWKDRQGTFWSLLEVNWTILHDRLDGQNNGATDRPTDRPTSVATKNSTRRPVVINWRRAKTQQT